MGKIYQRNGKYGIDYSDTRGKRIRKLVATDKTVAHQMLANAENAVARVRAGILTTDPQDARRDLSGQISEYVNDLQRLGRADMYIYIVRKHLEAAAEHQGWGCIADITPRSISAFLLSLSKRKLAAKSINDYRGDVSAFLAWAVRNQIAETNACDQIPKTTVKAEKKRRALSTFECRALLAAAPPDRRTVYLFLVFTGLRRSEAAEIRRGHLHLDAANPHVEIPASITKSARHETVPLVPELADALRTHCGGARDNQPVFPSIPTMDEFRADLTAAGIEHEDGRGRKVVLHSLRHSLATMLAVNAVPMAFAQRIMRHSDIRLTAQTYTDEALLPLSAAMNDLPRLSPPVASPTTAKAV